LMLRPPSDRQKVYERRAIELLRLAVTRGYGDFTTMQADADLEAVRSLPGYREVLGETGLRRYSSVWGDSPLTESQGLSGLPPAAHLARCRELAAKGYRPVALSLAWLPQTKSPFAASAWHRPVAPANREAVERKQVKAAAALLALERPEQ